jgi:hypothetical protein
MKAICLLVMAIWSTTCLPAAQYYSSYDASLGGSGTLMSPWTLKVALTNSVILSGDTLWLRGGTYTGLFLAQLHGTNASPVTVRNYANERAIIDGQLDLDVSTYTWLLGLEFIDSQKATRSNPFETIRMGSIGTKVINCLIHDCCNGIAPPGVYEAYGNVMWNCGKSGLEHALYYQNNGIAAKVIEDNLIGYPSGFGVHCYGTLGEMKNLSVIGNAVWEPGNAIDPKAGILLGGALPVIDGVIVSNLVYSRGPGIQIGYAASDTNATVTDNYSVGSPSVTVKTVFDSLVITNNTFGTVESLVVSSPSNFISSGSRIWDRNSAYSVKFNWDVRYAVVGGTNMGFTDWKTQSGFDAASTYSNSYPMDRVVVRPNRYAAKRANIVAVNWAAAENVSADVSGVLSIGDPYDLISAQNYFAGSVKSGIYDGSPLQIPMTNLSIAPVLYWTPSNSLINVTTNFAAFVLVGRSPTAQATANSATVGRISVR